MFDKPWINGSLEVLDLAIEQYSMAILSSETKISNKYLRFSLITADNAVELGTKGFIEFELNKLVKQNYDYYTIFNILNHEEPYKSDIEFKKIINLLKLYHKQRNQLYHGSFSPAMSRLQVLKFLFYVLTYFRKLYGTDFETSLQFEVKRKFLFLNVESEHVITTLAKENRIKIDDSFSTSDLLISLKDCNVIKEESREFFEQVIDINQKLTPSSLDLVDLYSVSITLQDEIKKLRDKII